MTSGDQTQHVEPGPDDRGREERKRDRQMIELLNELRVALPGVQILFAFLLTVPFTQRFPQLTTFQRDVGTKDTGGLFGVHGGALDRLDAAFFTLVAGYYVWLVML